MIDIKAGETIQELVCKHSIVLFQFSSKSCTPCVAIRQRIEAMKYIENAVLLDVRSKEEYSGGHIPGSKNVPVENIEKVVDVIADKNTPVFVYCLRGSRSASAVSAMEKMGYTNAKSIGGIVSYKGKTVIGSN